MGLASKTRPLCDAARPPQHGTPAKSNQVKVMVSPCCQPSCRHCVFCKAYLHAMPADNHCNQLQRAIQAASCGLAAHSWPLPQVHEHFADWPLGHSTPLLD